MRRRLDLAMTLVGDPRLIFLDEPTTGLDPRSRHAMWQIIRGLVAEGVTVFLTTQYLDEADQLADRIALLDHGRIVIEGTPDELKRRIPGGHILLRFTDSTALHTRRPRTYRRPARRRRPHPADPQRRRRPLAARRARPARRRTRRGRPPHDPHPRPGRRLLRLHRHARIHRRTGRHHRGKPMTSLAYTLTDSATMLPPTDPPHPALPLADRDADRHPGRFFLLLFVYVFGGTLGAGLPGGRRPQRLHQLPGARHPAVQRGRSRPGTAISVAMDMTEGIVDRFRSMAISRASLLTGHVLGSLVQTFLLHRRRARHRAGLASASGRPPPRSSGSPWPACSPRSRSR